MIIRRIGPLSFGKVMGAVYGVLGFLLGLLISGMSLMSTVFPHAAGGPSGGLFRLLFGVFAVVALPIFYGAMGFVMGLLMAGLYNLMARLLGGVEIEFQANPGPSPNAEIHPGEPSA